MVLHLTNDSPFHPTHRHIGRGTSYSRQANATLLTLHGQLTDGSLMALVEVSGTRFVFTMMDWHNRSHQGVFDFLSTCTLQTATPNLPNGTTMAVYEDAGADLWVRPEAEFNDGRFEALQ